MSKAMTDLQLTLLPPNESLLVINNFVRQGDGKGVDWGIIFDEQFTPNYINSMNHLDLCQVIQGSPLEGVAKVRLGGNKTHPIAILTTCTDAEPQLLEKKVSKEVDKEAKIEKRVSKKHPLDNEQLKEQTAKASKLYFENTRCNLSYGRGQIEEEDGSDDEEDSDSSLTSPVSPPVSPLSPVLLTVLTMDGGQWAKRTGELIMDGGQWLKQVIKMEPTKQTTEPMPTSPTERPGCTVHEEHLSH